MIKLTTTVDVQSGLPKICHGQRMLMMGSCFADNIGLMLKNAGFRVDVNPFGVLYNPLSIEKALRQIIDGVPYDAGNLYSMKGLWHSDMHHGSFSTASQEETLSMINSRLEAAHGAVSGSLDWLLLTFGTAYVYTDKATGEVVSNCHKRPESDFMRRRIGVDEIVDVYIPLIDTLRMLNPDLKIVFTVSPIRHIRDGLSANQLSKSTLLLAVDALRSHYPDGVFYFPSYEIMMDELRDYRFYADDLVHPSPLAVEYIRERFADVFFSAETKKVMAECESLNKQLQHRPLHPDSEEYKRFLGQIVLKVRLLKEKYPYLELDYNISPLHK